MYYRWVSGSKSTDSFSDDSHLGWLEVKVKVAQSCLTLCDTMDYKVHEIIQARILWEVAFPFSRGSSQPRDRTQVSCITERSFTNWAKGSIDLFLYKIYKFGEVSIMLGSPSCIMIKNPPANAGDTGDVG